MCRFHQLLSDESAPEAAKTFKALQLFCNKHQPIIGVYGVGAMDLRLDTTRGLREAVVVYLKSVPNETRPGQAFKAMHAVILLFEAFGERRAQFPRESAYKFHEEQQQFPEMISCVIVAAVDIDSCLVNACPMSFGQDVFMMVTGNDWTGPFIDALHHGTCDGLDPWLYG